MALQIPAAPRAVPPVLTCAGCQAVCDPADDLRTTEAWVAVCADCWPPRGAPAAPRIEDPVKAAKAAFYARVERLRVAS
jgi:hypothetical protein